MTSSPGFQNGFVMNQTMLRIRDPAKSVPFYRDILGMTLIERFDFSPMKFSLYFMGFPESVVPENRAERIEWLFRQKALLELTHNWGTEADPAFRYHDGNAEPRGFGHIGVSVPDVYQACSRFESLGVPFVKRPEDGMMKGLAFIKDPDGYWIEILAANSLKDLIMDATSANSLMK